MIEEKFMAFTLLPVACKELVLGNDVLTFPFGHNKPHSSSSTPQSLSPFLQLLPLLSLLMILLHKIIKLYLANLGKNVTGILSLSRRTIIYLHCSFAVLPIAPCWVSMSGAYNAQFQKLNTTKYIWTKSCILVSFGKFVLGPNRFSRTKCVWYSLCDMLKISQQKNGFHIAGEIRRKKWSR